MPVYKSRFAVRPIAEGEAEELESDRFGTRYKLEGVLKGPSGKALRVVTIWLRKVDGRVHFVTLVPQKRKGSGDESSS